MVRRLALLLLLGLAGCSGPDVINALVPEKGYRVLRDLPYGEGPRRRLDLYLPERPAEDAPREGVLELAPRILRTTDTIEALEAIVE